MKNSFKYFLFIWVPSVFCLPEPVSQPAYQTNQYLSAQVLPQVQYKQPEAPGYVQVQPQYVRQQITRPVHEPKREGLQNYATQDQSTQVIFGTSVDRQVQSPDQLQYDFQPLLASQARQAFQVAQQKKYVSEPQQYQTEQYQTQPQQYVVEKPQVRYITKQVPAKQRPQQIKQREEEDYDPNPSYQFGFDVKDELNTNYQNRKEQREGNKITGSYSVVDSDGFIRTVSYTADPKEGFKAEVHRQPTDIVVKIPKPLPQFQAVPKQRVQYVEEQQQPHPQQRRPVEERRQPANVVYQYQ
ncbi:bromodomain-containing protein DDB_G0280777-like [Diabrotica virgifera virgifera]|uniref:Bromodomain-containing protein DDB_G0280777-like n=1 Tax=Diabrotica virgifera virgifera TaxID=50390 RepID=A0A6P7G3F5_DIAVI|nr:bromodomain-containing protein DDB_G0280777-like [Diabrotica virgifera virgifera]